MLEQVIYQSDIHSILTEMRDNLPSNKYDVGQKVISELCSKLVEKITANHFTNKLNIPVIPGNHDVDPDCLFKFATGDVPLEVKVALGDKGGRCRWRGGGLSDRTSDYLLVSRNRDSTEFFVAITHLTKNDWIIQKTAYYAPFFTEELLYARPHTILCGSWGVMSKGKRKGKPIIIMEKL